MYLIHMKFCTYVYLTKLIVIEVKTCVNMINTFIDKYIQTLIHTYLYISMYVYTLVLMVGIYFGALTKVDFGKLLLIIDAN